MQLYKDSGKKIEILDFVNRLKYFFSIQVQWHFEFELELLTKRFFFIQVQWYFEFELELLTKNFYSGSMAF
jgi:hypothetical protein